VVHRTPHNHIKSSHLENPRVGKQLEQLRWDPTKGAKPPVSISQVTLAVFVTTVVSGVVDVLVANVMPAVSCVTIATTVRMAFMDVAVPCMPSVAMVTVPMTRSVAFVVAAPVVTMHACAAHAK
jgi:hypothetical protein